MAEKVMTVEERLKALFDLQLVMSDIDKIRTLRGELPLEVQDLEDDIAGLETRISKYKEDIEELETAISTKKNEIEEAKMLIEKYTEQQNNVRNNREYDSLSKEIEFQGLEIELFEKRIKEFTAEIGQKKESVEGAETELKERNEDLEAKKGELNEIVNETKVDEESLRDKAQQIETNIESRLLTAFKRIRRNARNGLAVVTVERDACGGCFNKIPPQRQLDIKQHKKVIVCEYCGRILVDNELKES
ncbi:zinc ribbon domain-containing protein [Saccharicrinis sp. FJH2]|uniref:zinc ribbon domain-containing protein n=1 Tax=unclassified Saccharicrinis TaxID=2646859 RepID=UPI0035D4F8E0